LGQKGEEGGCLKTQPMLQEGEAEAQLRLKKKKKVVHGCSPQNSVKKQYVSKSLSI